MTKYLVANWKSHKTLSQAEKWLETFCAKHKPDPQVTVVIAPPAVYLVPLHQMLQEQNGANLSLAVQDLSPFPLGSYTGAIAADMLHNIAAYAIIGHSERRRYFHETPQEIANKAAEAILGGIKPILCVDRDYARSQIAALEEAYLGNLIIGYGPVEAVGLDIPQPPEKIRAAVEEIKIIVPDAPILYGGSINSDNAADIMETEGVSGLMVGTACLDADEFAGIHEAVSQG